MKQHRLQNTLRSGCARGKRDQQRMYIPNNHVALVASRDFYSSSWRTAKRVLMNPLRPCWRAKGCGCARKTMQRANYYNARNTAEVPCSGVVILQAARAPLHFVLRYLYSQCNLPNHECYANTSAFRSRTHGQLSGTPFSLCTAVKRARHCVFPSGVPRWQVAAQDIHCSIMRCWAIIVGSCACISL